MADPSFPPSRPIVLVGMPGAGKSSVGLLLANRLSLPFFDTDAEVEQEAGMSVSEMFDAQGEASFRRSEASAAARLIERGPSVVATGGGTLIDPTTRSAILNRCVVVWLKASPETLAWRLGDCSGRPLLNGGKPLAAIRRLAAERAGLYAQAPIRIDTDEASPEEIAAAVEMRLRAEPPRPPAVPGRGAGCRD